MQVSGLEDPTANADVMSEQQRLQYLQYYHLQTSSLLCFDASFVTLQNRKKLSHADWAYKCQSKCMRKIGVWKMLGRCVEEQVETAANLDETSAECTE